MKLLINTLKLIFKAFFKLLMIPFNIGEGFISNSFRFLFFGTLPPKKTGARFLSNKEQKQVLNSSNKGLVIDGEDKRLSEKASYTHIAIIAKTGAGKTTNFIYPNLFTLADQKCSIVVTDPSGELFSTTSAYMKKRGFSVFVLDPLNLNRSIRYNPLANIKTYTQASKIAHTLILSANTNPSSNGDFWTAGGQTIIEIFIQCLMNLPIKYKNLHNVLYLLQMFGSNGKKLANFISHYAINPNDPNDKSLLNKWFGFISNDEEVRANFVTTAKVSLKKLEDPQIAKLTASNTFDFKQFRRQKTILYICFPSHESSYYAFLLNLFFTQFFSFCMEELYKPNKDLPIYALYDEFGHSSIPDFSSVSTTIRKYAVSISIILQSISQLEERYGKVGAETILSGGIASKLFYSGADLDTAFILQNTLGKVKKTYYEEKKGFDEIHENNLLNVDEIRTIKEDQAIFITGREHPILLDVKPYYKNNNFKQYTKLGACNIQNNIQDKLEYIKL